MNYQHRTQTGTVELIDEWGHGKPESGNWDIAPAVFKADDGDGHYSAWRWSGKIEDAHDVVAGFMTSDNNVIMRDGINLKTIQTPDDFWEESWKKDGTFDVSAKYSRDCIAY